jgi:hypothetical protein
VAKLIFWNAIVGALLLHYGNSFTIRFFITFAIMFILALTLALKVFLSVLYYFTYAYLKVKDKPAHKKRKVSLLLEEFSNFEGKIKRSI